MRESISVVIPTYNSGKTIQRCLNSLINQSVLPFEVIIVDGCSSDDTVITLQNTLSESRLHWRLFQSPPKGVFAAMNIGLDVVNGAWVYFLGSDDALFSYDTLERVTPCLDKDASAVYGSVRVVGDTDWAANGALYDGEFSVAKLQLKNICQQSIFYNRRYIQDLRFNPEERITADWSFNKSLWGEGPFKYVNLTIARFYAGGLSSSLTMRR